MISFEDDGKVGQVANVMISRDQPHGKIVKIDDSTLNARDVQFRAWDIDRWNAVTPWNALPLPTTLSVADWMDAMITYSDNGATRALLLKLHQMNQVSAMNAGFAALGLTSLMAPSRSMASRTFKTSGRAMPPQKSPLPTRPGSHGTTAPMAASWKTFPAKPSAPTS